MEAVIAYKNHYRDMMCTNQAVFKKYGWLVEEISLVDYDPTDKKGVLDEVCTTHLYMT